ncbi:protein of unknown function [Pseudorhizobium banfieldiae]|uniref:Uncharacterized protein n=1 Tax=Pseudorhizobium banfieldiae TaxID=1125847 RepID=L0NLE1_9HYPH|nr:protein of unknown function [Pseudorhizobium banfieldiae]
MMPYRSGHWRNLKRPSRFNLNILVMFVHALSGFSIVRRARGWRTSTRFVEIVVRGNQTVIARAHRPLCGCTPPSDASLRTG